MPQKHVRRPLRYAPGQGHHRRQTVSLSLQNQLLARQWRLALVEVRCHLLQLVHEGPKRLAELVAQ
eukprot:11259861-Alexandrium_andersonii.AAC.1